MQRWQQAQRTRERRPVQRLDHTLVSQIAAGEVVERPASAVKELVENAIDAGATRITVELDDGGRTRLCVTDDGSGMGPDDALLALERHTTSKLGSAEDLFRIASFGFRGEALASIASVSRLTLTTRRAQDLEGTRLHVEGGTIRPPEAVGAPPGTRIEVRDLFFNVPVRLKFLKTRSTELTHTVDWVSRLALAHPGVGFVVRDGGREQLRCDPTDDPRERIAAVLGREVHGALYPVSVSEGAVSVEGFGAGPQRSHHTAREIFLFVNGRFVRDRSLQHAVGRAYERVLAIGRHPSCVLFIDVDPAVVDVNVHPQKLEVRFDTDHAQKVGSLVYRALSDMLERSPWLRTRVEKTYTVAPSVPVSTQPRPVETPTPMTPMSTGGPRPLPPTPIPAQVVARHGTIADLLGRIEAGRPSSPSTDLGTNALEPTSESATSQPIPTGDDDSIFEAESSVPVMPPGIAPLVRPGQSAEWTPVRPDATQVAFDGLGSTAGSTGESLRFRDLRYLGQVHRTYLVCESPDGIVVLDQHAAHERIVYERLKRERAGADVRGTPYLIPVTLHYGAGDAALVESQRAALADLGLEVESFGPTSYVLKAAPDGLRPDDWGSLVRDFAAMAAQHGPGAGADALEEEMLIRLSCHTAVRAGDAMSELEVKSLLEQLDGTPFQAQCPHGRPVMVRWTVDVLKELFARTYEGTSKSSRRERAARG